ncbi:MAG TPA: alanine racemase [Rickettsiales bacterium]|nr:alanine racemase [Rickettsiales bacterium]
MHSPHYPTLEVSLEAVARNYTLLKRKGAGRCAAVVKANAYGLGAEEVAPALYHAGCRDFFVATLDEGIALRQVFRKHSFAQADIYVFHGVRAGQASEFAAYGLIPVLNDRGQIEHWRDSGRYALHIDTGMCRLGVTPRELDALPPVTGNLQLVMSHLANAGDPQSPQNAEQLEAFRQALHHFPGIPASLANSSGVFLGKEYHFDLLRPGCSLYGISPNTSLPNPVENVVRLSAPVLQYRFIGQDQLVGYGGEGRAGKGAVLATLELGYADGFLRALGNRAYGFAEGIKVPIIGRVSMDMVSVDLTAVPEHLRTPDLRITFIGHEQPVDIVAETAGTIGYEIFTRLGTRVRRVYA